MIDTDTNSHKQGPALFRIRLRLTKLVETPRLAKYQGGYFGSNSSLSYCLDSMPRASYTRSTARVEDFVLPMQTCSWVLESADGLPLSGQDVTTRLLDCHAGLGSRIEWLEHEVDFVSVGMLRFEPKKKLLQRSYNCTFPSCCLKTAFLPFSSSMKACP